MTTNLMELKSNEVIREVIKGGRNYVFYEGAQPHTAVWEGAVPVENAPVISHEDIVAFVREYASNANSRWFKEAENLQFQMRILDTTYRCHCTRNGKTGILTLVVRTMPFSNGAVSTL